MHTEFATSCVGVHDRARACATDLQRTRQSFSVQIRALACRSELSGTDQSFIVQNRALAWVSDAAVKGEHDASGAGIVELTSCDGQSQPCQNIVKTHEWLDAAG